MLSGYPPFWQPGWAHKYHDKWMEALLTLYKRRGRIIRFHYQGRVPIR